MRRLRLIGLAGLTALWLAAPAAAQQPVWTVPQPGTSAAAGNASGSIAVTNTFQKVFSGTSSAPGALPGSGGTRHGCTIQNNGTNTMWVAEGTTAAAASKNASAVLAAGQVYFCNAGGTVLTGEIDITGTAGDKFYAAQF